MKYADWSQNAGNLISKDLHFNNFLGEDAPEQQGTTCVGPYIGSLL